MRKLIIFAAAFLTASANLKAQLNVYFINVNQGDAIYIEFPNGTNALIDGGPSGALVTAFLKKKGVTRLDRVVLTHPHGDHYRGLKKVFTDLEVDNYYDTRAENVDAIGDNNLRELAELEPGCRTHYPESGDNLAWDSRVTVKVLNACHEPVQIHDNDETNNCSLVLRLYYNGTGILLMGDAESSIENDIARLFKSGLQSYALKVAHHGSRYSTSDYFLSRVRPKVAIVSAGVNNVYGHPHKETIDRLRSVGAKIYYTVLDTQLLSIPEPRKGVAPVLDLVAYDPLAHMQPAAVRDVIYTPEIQVPASVNSEALDQLIQAAPAN